MTRWRLGLLICLLAACAPTQAAPPEGTAVYPSAAPAPEVPAPQARAEPARPSARVLRDDLQQILSRPEYRARGRDWLWDLKLRLLRALMQWWEQRLAPLFGNLYAAQPVVYWSIFVLLLLLLLGILYHIYYSLRSAFGTNIRRRAKAGEPVFPSRLGAPEDLLREADAAAEGGQFALAFRWLYLALIRHLDRQALVRFDGSATNYDYLRQVRDHPELTRHLEPLTRAVEPVWYGYREATADDYRRCRQWALAAWREGGQDAAV